MLTKCANPGCEARFRYLHDGRVFRIERPAHQTPHLSDKKAPRIFEHYWLCDACGTRVTLAIDPGGEVIAVPLEQTLRQRAAAS